MSVFTITQGDIAKWTFDFVDPVTGIRQTVTGGNLTLSYRFNKSPTTTVIALSQVGAFWSASWNSTNSDLGYGDWSVLATGQSLPNASGRLRVVTDP